MAEDKIGDMISPQRDWTLLSLKEYIERRFNDQGKAIDAALAAAEKAVTKAEIATEKRFDSVNEFRKTLADQQSQFLFRGEYIAQHRALEEKVDNLSKIQNYLIGGLVLMSFVTPIAVTMIMKFGDGLAHQ